MSQKCVVLIRKEKVPTVVSTAFYLEPLSSISGNSRTDSSFFTVFAVSQLQNTTHANKRTAS